MSQPIQISPPRRRYLVMVFLLAALIVATATYWLYRIERERLISRQYETLRVMGDLKEAQLRSWLDERRKDAERLKTNPLLIHNGARLLRNPEDRSPAVILREWLQAQLMGDTYQNVLLIDKAGEIILAAKADPPSLDAITKAAIPRAVTENRAIQGDFYRRAGDGKTIGSDTLAPVRDRAGRLLFLVVLQSDARQFLFPLLQTWYAFTATGEAVLVRREGDKVLYLNDLRHQPHAALDLSFPLTREDLPAVQAISGLRGSFSGRNYRGAPVLADLRSIGGTPWFMVAQMEKEEALADLSLYLETFSIIAFLLILLTGTALAYFYRLKRARLYREAWQSQQAQWESEERFRATIYSIGDGVIMTDAQGRVRQMNLVAESLTGWTEPQAVGLPLEKIFDFVCEHTRAAAENPIAKVLREGPVVGLANHTLLLARDGVERPIADSAAPIRNQEGEIIGAVLVFRDQTEERASLWRIEESERKVSALLANLPGMAYRCRNDADWTAEFVSDGCLALTGWRPEEFMNRAVSYDVLIHPDDRAYVRREVEAAVAQRRPYNIEYRIRTREGEEKWVWEKGRLASAANGGAALLDCFISDINERRKAEDLLRKAQYRLAQTVDFLPDPTFVIDAEGKVLTWNRAMEDLSGVATADMVGRSDYAYAVPFYGHPRPLMIDLALLHDESIASSYASFSREESRIVSESYLSDFRGRGETWLWNTASALQDENNHTLGAIESVRDITRQKKRERELEGALSILDAALEATADGILIVDLQGKIVRWNRKLQEMFGIPDDVLFCRDDARIFDCISSQLTDPVAVANRIRELSLNPEETGLDIIEFTDGRVFERQSHPHRLGKTIVGRVLSFRDLTASRRAQEEGRLLTAQFHESQKMEAVGRLAGGIAHDFNNMLSVILGQAKFVSMQLEETSPVQAHIEAITKAAERAAELVRQLLGYARRQIIDPQVIDLNEVAEGILKLLRRLIGENVDLVWKPSGHLWPVKIDPSQINQLLSNLTVNARDAIKGHGIITIETGNVVFDDLYCKTHFGVVPGEYVILSVSDNGCGIDKEAMGRIFEPFYTTKPIGVGTGLGLPTVYGIVKQNGGFINVYSEPGLGSTFKIYLPKNDEAQAEKTIAEPPVSLAKGNETILLVEDERALLEIGGEILTLLGYHVLPAASPLQALTLVKEFEGDIHLVITDVVMPEMNGEELIREISALRSGLKFLYMSGYTANVIVHQGILDEGLNFIQKPFSLEAMATKIRTILDGPG